MILTDFHVHTNYSDGKHSPEEVVLSAIEKGITKLGFSDHSYTFFDESYCIPKVGMEEYRKEIFALKEKYKDKIEIYCGIEQDIFSEMPTEAYDYVIGSVHYVRVGEEYITVDYTAQTLTEGAEKHFGGDIYSLIEAYYEAVGELVEKTDCHIIGHIDLITKFNEGGKMFDEADERYVNAFRRAVDRLIGADRLFEINTGAISRGYRTEPYPSKAITEYIREKGGRFILSSDSHNAETLRFDFDTAGTFVKGIALEDEPFG